MIHNLRTFGICVPSCNFLATLTVQISSTLDLDTHPNIQIATFGSPDDFDSSRMRPTGRVDEVVYPAPSQ